MPCLRQVASLALALCLCATAALAAERVPAAHTPAAFRAVVGTTPPSGTGPLVVYRTRDRALLSISDDALDRLFFWSVEAARFPESAVSRDGNSVGEAVVTLERRGGAVMVRNQSPRYLKRSPDDIPTLDGAGLDARSASTIGRAIDAAALGPVLAALPIVAEGEGRLLLDLTPTFSGDIDGLSASRHILSSGRVPAPIGLTVDASRSYIADIDAYPNNLHVRSHLTFRAMDPASPALGYSPVSIEVGHSLLILPETPMPARRYDDRVGFSFVDFTEFELEDGRASSGVLQGLVKRFRLEKANPSAAVSDPVQPIVFYIGQGVPDRWRPAIKAAVESWQPAFLEAGFSNAIVARDAPTPEQDPQWSAEDARYNVIRWVPQPFANAMGPSVSDPRSGEILFAHILLWPDVLDFFSNYYWLMAHGLDPAVQGLPLGEAAQSALLQYIVAHEVGHSIGLRHNHLASTAYTVAELRDPAFANQHGPNASIMAYGRANQAAQPGDGVTRVIGAQGPYDFFAINWGYGVHGASQADEQAALDRLADESTRNRLTRWAAGEAGFEDAWMLDPRVQMENVGSERVLATRLGLTKLVGSMAALDAAATDDQRFRSAYRQGLSHFDLLMGSVLKLVGGQYVGEGDGSRPRPVPVAEQRAGVLFLLDEGPAFYDVFLRPELVLRADPVAGATAVDKRRAAFVGALLSPATLARVHSQRSIDARAYGVPAYAADITDIVWGDLDQVPAWRAAQQEAYLDGVARLLAPSAAPDPAAVAALTAQMYSPGYIATQLATGRETVFAAFARESLPGIRTRLDRAARSESDPARRLHLRKMSDRITALLDA